MRIEVRALGHKGSAIRTKGEWIHKNKAKVTLSFPLDSVRHSKNI